MPKKKVVKKAAKISLERMMLEMQLLNREQLAEVNKTLVLILEELKKGNHGFTIQLPKLVPLPPSDNIAPAPWKYPGIRGTSPDVRWLNADTNVRHDKNGDPILN